MAIEIVDLAIKNMKIVIFHYVYVYQRVTPMN